MGTGIRDKVVIFGMGCTRFGERWESGAEDLLVEAFQECIEDAGIEPQEIQAAWLGTCFGEIGMGPSPPSRALSPVSVVPADLGHRVSICQPGGFDIAGVRPRGLPPEGVAAQRTRLP
jgi:acetyl-CoA acetyltransferase